MDFVFRFLLWKQGKNWKCFPRRAMAGWAAICDYSLHISGVFGDLWRRKCERSSVTFRGMNSSSSESKVFPLLRAQSFFVRVKQGIDKFLPWKSSVRHLLEVKQENLHPWRHSKLSWEMFRAVFPNFEPNPLSMGGCTGGIKGLFPL